MGCGCSGSKTQEWVFTSPTGEVSVHPKEIEAKVAKIKAGGGTIQPREK